MERHKCRASVIGIAAALVIGFVYWPLVVSFQHRAARKTFLSTNVTGGCATWLDPNDCMNNCECGWCGEASTFHMRLCMPALYFNRSAANPTCVPANTWHAPRDDCVGEDDGASALALALAGGLFTVMVLCILALIGIKLYESFCQRGNGNITLGHANIERGPNEDVVCTEETPLAVPDSSFPRIYEPGLYHGTISGAATGDALCIEGAALLGTGNTATTSGAIELDDDDDESLQQRAEAET